jgi:hypothetical protein
LIVVNCIALNPFCLSFSEDSAPEPVAFSMDSDESPPEPDVPSDVDPAWEPESAAQQSSAESYDPGEGPSGRQRPAQGSASGYETPSRSLVERLSEMSTPTPGKLRRCVSPKILCTQVNALHLVLS